MSEQFAEEMSTSTKDREADDENQGDEMLKKRNRNIEHLECEFCDIFHQAITKLFNLDEGNNILYLRRYLRFLYPETKTWCELKNQKDKDFEHLLKCSLFYRLTYIYRIGVVLASATAFHFQNILVENPELTKMLLKKRSVKICSLASGCALDVIGIVKVLETVARVMRIELEILVTVIDADEAWKNTSITALSCLEQFRGAIWKIKFIDGDVSSKEISANVVKAIQESDIVTMANMNIKNKIETILNNITDAVRPGSLMFILDSSRLPFIKSCGGQTGAINNFQLIYEELCQVYTLQASSAEKLFVLYHKYFPNFGCDRILIVFVRAWVKPSDITSKTSVHYPDNSFLISRDHRSSLYTENFYHNWDVRFSKEMAKHGWNRKDTKKIISIHKDHRCRLMKEQFESKKLVNIKRKKLADPFLQDAEKFSQNEIDEKEWEDHYNAKQELARVQKDVYNISMFHLKCSLKRNILGPAKKEVKKIPVLNGSLYRKREH